MGLPFGIGKRAGAKVSTSLGVLERRSNKGSERTSVYLFIYLSIYFQHPEANFTKHQTLSTKRQKHGPSYGAARETRQRAGVPVAQAHGAPHEPAPPAAPHLPFSCSLLLTHSDLPCFQHCSFLPHATAHAIPHLEHSFLQFCLVETS